MVNSLSETAMVEQLRQIAKDASDENFQVNTAVTFINRRTFFNAEQLYKQPLPVLGPSLPSLLSIILDVCST